MVAGAEDRPVVQRVPDGLGAGPRAAAQVRVQGRAGPDLQHERGLQPGRHPQAQRAEFPEAHGRRRRRAGGDGRRSGEGLSRDPGREDSGAAVGQRDALDDARLSAGRDRAHRGVPDRRARAAHEREAEPDAAGAGRPARHFERRPRLPPGDGAGRGVRARPEVSRRAEDPERPAGARGEEGREVRREALQHAGSHQPPERILQEGEDDVPVGPPLAGDHREPGRQAGAGIQGRLADVLRGRRGLLERGGPAGVRHDDDHDELRPAAAGRLRAHAAIYFRNGGGDGQGRREGPAGVHPGQGRGEGRRREGGGAGESREVRGGCEEERALPARHLRAAGHQDDAPAGAVRLRAGAVRGHLPDQPGRAGLHAGGQGREVRRSDGDRAPRQRDGRLAGPRLRPRLRAALHPRALRSAAGHPRNEAVHHGNGQGSGDPGGPGARDEGGGHRRGALRPLGGRFPARRRRGGDDFRFPQAGRRHGDHDAADLPPDAPRGAAGREAPGSRGRGIQVRPDRRARFLAGGPEAAGLRLRRGGGGRDEGRRAGHRRRNRARRAGRHHPAAAGVGRRGDVAQGPRGRDRRRRRRDGLRAGGQAPRRRRDGDLPPHARGNAGAPRRADEPAARADSDPGTLRAQGGRGRRRQGQGPEVRDDAAGRAGCLRPAAARRSARRRLHAGIGRDHRGHRPATVPGFPEGQRHRDEPQGLRRGRRGDLHDERAGRLRGRRRGQRRAALAGEGGRRRQEDRGRDPAPRGGRRAAGGADALHGRAGPARAAAPAGHARPARGRARAAAGEAQRVRRSHPDDDAGGRAGRGRALPALRPVLLAVHERVSEPGLPDLRKPAVRGGSGDLDGAGRPRRGRQAAALRRGAGLADGGADGLLQRVRQLRDVLPDRGPALRRQAAAVRREERIRGAGRQRVPDRGQRRGAEDRGPVRRRDA